MARHDLVRQRYELRGIWSKYILEMTGEGWETRAENVIIQDLTPYF